MLRSGEAPDPEPNPTVTPRISESSSSPIKAQAFGTPSLVLGEASAAVVVDSPEASVEVLDVALVSPPQLATINVTANVIERALTNLCR
jgi:hypothetical protein